MHKCLGLFVLLLAWTATAHGQAPLTESDVVRIGLERTGFAAGLSASRDEAEATARGAGLWDNPELEFSHEGIDVSGGQLEERSYWLRQRFNLAGVRALERRAALALSSATNSRLASDRSEQAALIRHYFHEVLAASHRAQALERWHQRLARLVQSIEARSQAGDAARFDVLRLRHELGSVNAETLEAHARARSARTRLFSLIDHEPLDLQGELLPPQTEPIDAQRLAISHPQVQALDAEIRAAELSAQASKRERWPEMTLGLGHRQLREPGLTANGNLIMIGLELPLFDRGAERSDAADARVRQLTAEREVLSTHLAAEASAALNELQARRAAALELARLGQEDSLVEIAEGAYQAGEISVLELIDAHRTELVAKQDATRWALLARKSYIELQRMRGEP